MNLQDIGFYTLTNDRVKNASMKSPLYRCEMVLTDACNFKCKYCRGLNQDIKGTIDYKVAMETLKIWTSNGLKNVRFTGGEPLLYKKLPNLIEYCKKNGVKRIAVSSNGSLPLSKYKDLIDCGVNDFSISLDGGCCSVGDLMSGVSGSWEKVVENIKEISKLTYITVGMVFTEQNISSAVESVLFAHSLGVSDVRVIPAAQYNQALINLKNLPENILNKLPILKYRISNIKNNISVRGLDKKDTHKCWLALDDMAVAKNYHYPCIIYLREQGNYIGKISNNIREDRFNWILNHDPLKDVICKNNCLDVCSEYNRQAEKLNSWVKSFKKD